DAGVAVASETFKRELKEVEKSIDERHSGASGFFVGLWDAATGLPGWVVKAYDKAEQAFGDEICRAAREISTEVNGVGAACQALIKDARARISALFSDLPANLRSWAAQEQGRIGAQLDHLQQQAADTKANFTRDLVA